MSVIDPLPGEAEPIIEEPAAVAVLPPSPSAPSASREVCKSCKRGIFLAGDKWFHWDPRVDLEGSPVYHVAELFVPDKISWGHLHLKGKSDLSVTQGPSKVRSGWSGNGVA